MRTHIQTGLAHRTRANMPMQKVISVGIASHHMRTPLTTIRWYVELLRSNEAGTLNRRQAEALAEIEVGVRDVVSLLNELFGTLAGAEDCMVPRAKTKTVCARPRRVKLGRFV